MIAVQSDSAPGLREIDLCQQTQLPELYDAVGMADSHVACQSTCQLTPWSFFSFQSGIQ